MKNVLVITYSQSGQLAEIARRIAEPLSLGGHRVHVETLVPEIAFPWPWPILDFIDAFPECVQLDPPPLRPLQIPEGVDWDLVIITYQVWFLSPALPITAFLKSPRAVQLLKGKPVVSVVACRNMWLSAQQTLQSLILAAGGRLCDHVALTDPGHPLATFITTPRWVLTGRRDRFLGLPPAGVAPNEVAGATRFGKALATAIDNNLEVSGQPMLTGLRAATVVPRLALSERAGFRAFKVWSKLIRACGRRGQWRRRPMLLVFAVYLVTLIITVVPLSLLVQWLLYPILKKRLTRLKAELEQPSGSAAHNIDLYAQ